MYLKAKAVIVAGKFASLTDASINVQVVQYCASTFQGLNLVSISSLKALTYYFDAIPAEHINAILPGLYQFILTILSSEDREEIVNRLLETFFLATKVNQAPLHQYQADVCTLIVHLYTKFPFESATSDMASEVLSSLITDPVISVGLENYVLPKVVEVLLAPPHDDSQGLIPSTLNLVKCLVEAKSELSHPLYGQQIVPLVVKLLLTTDDPSSHQYGHELLKHLLRKNINLFKSSSLTGDEPLIYSVFRLVIAVIQTKSESVGLFISEVANELLDTMKGELAPVIHELVVSVVNRLGTRPNGTYKAMLCTIVCRVLFYDDLFATVMNGVDQNLLGSFISEWMENISVGMNDFVNERVEMCALAKLLMVKNEAILSMNVQSDEVFQQTGSIFIKYI
jgi:hypothetical protein